MFVTVYTNPYAGFAYFYDCVMIVREVTAKKNLLRKLVFEIWKEK